MHLLSQGRVLSLSPAVFRTKTERFQRKTLKRSQRG
ncbi:hypothetical protein MGSAQ_001355 [marine sediment metagenome]|uniref:Uncharacterized protein n=1 Tax=marine sediment metagenome TaxID=412755 RepID=A0A1B6NUK5_9ZZZZ